MKRLNLALLTFALAFGSNAQVVDSDLTEYRRQRGQTSEGLPFYSAPEFDGFISAIKEIEQTSMFSQDSVRQLHETFIGSGDRDEAVWEGWLEVCHLVETLSEIKGCLQAPSAVSGWRATHQSSMKGHTNKLSWLARNGADFDAVTGPNTSGLRQTGFSPAHLAALRGNLDALDILERGGADLFKRAPGGYTPLDVARETKNHDAVRWLESKSGESRLLHQER